MTEKFTYRGIWFLPENPEHHVTGTLIFEPNSEPRLELMGTLIERTNGFHEPLFISGFSTDGKIISLYKSYENSRSVSMPGIEVSEYTPMYILIGKHFSSEEEFSFKVIKGRFKNLEQWINISGFQEVDTNFDTHETKIHYKLPEQIKFTLNSETTGSLNFTSSAPFHKQTMKALVEQKSEIHLEFTTAKPFHESLSTLLMFQNFLTLGTFETAYPTSITVVTINSDDEDDFTRIDVIYKPGFHYKNEGTRSAKTFLFEYKDIAEQFTTIIKKWFELEDRIEPVTNLLFDSFYHDEVFNENKFLNIIHALETFHRRFRKNEVLTSDEHSTKVKGIVALVPEDTKQWLQEKLNFTNEPSLHQRLEELLAEASNDTTDKIIKDKDQFIRDTKNSRNYFTHYDPRLEHKTLRGTPLMALTQRLRILLIIIIMKETGIPKETVDRVIAKRVMFFRHLFENN